MNPSDGKSLNERLLASARRQLAALEADGAAERAKSAGTAEALRLTSQHAANLEAIRTTLQDRIEALERQCAHLTGVIAARDEAIGALRATEARKTAMERSFSWQITAPLRWLRRAVRR